MADNVAITSGVGTTIATDDVSGVQFQKIKLDLGADGATVPATGDNTNGLDVDVTRVQGSVTVVSATATNLKVDASGVAVPVTDNAGSLTVDAPVATPLFVRLSSGSAAVDTIPISGAVTVSGTATVSGTVAATQSGTWNMGTLATITNVVHIDDNGGIITVDGAVTVSGTATVTQGTAAAAAGAWPMKITDGTDTVGISTVSATKAMKVDVVQTVFNFAQVDGATFTDLTSKAGIIGAQFNGFATDLTAGQAGALRCSPKRALHVVLQSDTSGYGNLGSATAPLVVTPAGTATFSISDNAGTITVDAPVATPVFVRLSSGSAAVDTIPVSGAVTITGPVSQTGGPWTQNITQIGGSAIVTAAAGIQKVGMVDGVGAVWSATNPVPVVMSGLSRTRVTNSNTLAASETAVAIVTPSASTKACVTSFTLTATVGGVVTIYDGTNSAANWLFKGTVPVGVTQIQFVQPWISAALNNVIRYTTGTGVVAELQMHSFESA